MDVESAIADSVSMPNNKLKKLIMFADLAIADSRQELNRGRGATYSGRDVSKSGGEWAIIYTNEGDDDELWAQLEEHFLAKFGEDRWIWDVYDHMDNPPISKTSLVVRMRGPRGEITAAAADCYRVAKAMS